MGTYAEHVSPPGVIFRKLGVRCRTELAAHLLSAPGGNYGQALRQDPASAL